MFWWFWVLQNHFLRAFFNFLNTTFSLIWETDHILLYWFISCLQWPRQSGIGARSWDEIQVSLWRAGTQCLGAITACSQGLHRKQPRVRSQNQASNPGTRMWDFAVFTARVNTPVPWWNILCSFLQPLGGRKKHHPSVYLVNNHGAAALCSELLSMSKGKTTAQHRPEMVAAVWQVLSWAWWFGNRDQVQDCAPSSA